MKVRSTRSEGDVRQVVIDVAREADMDRVGQMLADALPGSSVVGLIGTLGAGKTRLVRAIARAEGIAQESVQSPTFVLCHQHSGRRTIYHLDAYRIESLDEFLDLGVEEYWQAGGLSLVEWSDRVEGALPAERLDIEIDITGAESRRLTLRGHGPAYVAALKKLEA